jgi:hypothetical protein
MVGWIRLGWPAKESAVMKFCNLAGWTFACASACVLLAACGSVRPAHDAARIGEQHAQSSEAPAIDAQTSPPVPLPTVDLLQTPPWLWADIAPPDRDSRDAAALQALCELVWPSIRNRQGWLMLGKFPVDEEEFVRIMRMLRRERSVQAKLDDPMVVSSAGEFHVGQIHVIRRQFDAVVDRMLEKGDVANAILIAEAQLVMAWNLSTLAGATRGNVGLLRSAMYAHGVRLLADLQSQGHLADRISYEALGKQLDTAFEQSVHDDIHNPDALLPTAGKPVSGSKAERQP